MKRKTYLNNKEIINEERLNCSRCQMTEGGICPEHYFMQLNNDYFFKYNEQLDVLKVVKNEFNI